jgi:hypothetical protein
MNRDTLRHNQQLPGVSAVADGVILALWRQGLDTSAIAQHTKLAEWQVYNRLIHLRGSAQ